MKGLLVRRLSFRKDVGVTALNGLAVLTGVFVLNGLIARKFGLEALGQFGVMRRTILDSSGAILLGTSIALPALLSRDVDRSWGDGEALLFVTVFAPLQVLMVVCLSQLGLGGFSWEFFWAGVWYTLGTIAQLAAFGLYRGYLNMVGANLIQFLGTALIPLVCFAVFDSLNSAMTLSGVASFGLMVSAYVLRNAGVFPTAAARSRARHLLRYGIRRVPAFLGQFVLLAGPPIWMARNGGLVAVAFLASGISLVRLALFVVNPLGLVLLPRLSRRIEQGEKAGVVPALRGMFHLGLFLSAGILLALLPIVRELLTLWLGTADPQASRLVSITLLALPFYTLSGLARSPIDAASERGYNSWIYGTSVVFLVGAITLGTWLDQPMESSIPWAFVGAQAVAGGMSLLVVSRLYGHGMVAFRPIADIALGGLVVIALHYGVQALSSFHEAVRLAISSSVIFLGAGYLWKGSSAWLVEARTLVRSSGR